MQNLLPQAKELLTIFDAWQKLGLQGEPKRTCCSPFREEKNPSFSISPDGKLWKDFATDEGGSVVDFIAKALGCDIAEAIGQTISLAGLSSGSNGDSYAPAPRQAVKTPPKPEPLSKDTLREYGRLQAAAVEELLRDKERLAKIAEARGWRPDSLEALALDGHLGWHDGKLAFLYDHGLKLRSKAPDGSRVIRWLFGGNGELWRGSLLKIEAFRNRTVWICEGETDAISLLDADMEDEARLIVALPCANAWHAEWIAPLSGRSLVLALDADTAGEKAAASLMEKLSGFASSIQRLNLNSIFKL